MKSVKDFYSNSASYEWKRLVKDKFHFLEFETTLHFLKKYLPKTGYLLDAGGGPGRYTIELAKQGYEMALLDLTPELLDKARRQIARAKVKNKVKHILEGSITDLSVFPDGSFDAVLCLGGPMSHLGSVGERQKTTAELVRVTKPGGMIFVSVMGRLGIMIDLCLRWQNEVDMTTHFREIWKDGDDFLWHKNSYCHYYLPEELEKLFLGKGVKIVERVGLEGFTHVPKMANALARKFKNGWPNWLEAHWQYCTNPSVYATSGHMLLVLRKR